MGVYKRSYPLIEVKMTCIISYRQGPKTGMDFRPNLKTGVKNDEMK